MIEEFLQERAALYVSGTMSPQEREQFDLVLEFNDEVREFTVGLADVGVAVTLAAFLQMTLDLRLDSRPEFWA